MATQTERWLFTVDDLHRMAEAGIFKEDDRIELVDGEVRPMAPIKSRHAGIVNKLALWMIPELRGQYVVRIQNPVQLGHRTLFNPDVAVCWLRDDRYYDSNPTPGETLLVIEVSDSSLAYDSSQKVPLYGRNGVPEAWIVDVEGKTVTRFVAPGYSGYAASETFRSGDIVTCRSIEGFQIAVDDIV